jgi:argininosuccinate lyase
MNLWGGRFSTKLNEAAFALNASLPFDKRLAMQDVKGSIAWADALARAGVLDDDESMSIISGLEAVGAEFASGSFSFADSDEDIHTAVERRLGELIGPLAGKLHTGRSRNDQVATDFRLWMLDALPELDSAIASLQSTLVTLAEKHQSTLMPGYTHLQRAQPITLAHWLLSHLWPLQRDRERLVDLRKRVAILPLGCGALAGTAFPIDRAALAEALGFDPRAQQPGCRLRPGFRRGILVLCGDARSAPEQISRERYSFHHSGVRIFRTLGCLFDRLQPDAAEKEPRCVRAGARQSGHVDRPADRAAVHAQRVTVHL